MNTLWHLLWTYLIFRNKPWIRKGIIFSIIPDLHFFISNIIAYSIYGSGEEAWQAAWYHPVVLQVHYFMNSFVVVGLLILIFWLFKLKKVLPFVYVWGFHIIIDFFTHVNDAFPIFWPFSGMIFPSFVSYWETEHYSVELTIINLALFTIFAFYTKDEKYPKFGKLIYGVSSIGFIIFGFIVVFLWGAPVWAVLMSIIPTIILVLLYLRSVKRCRENSS